MDESGRTYLGVDWGSREHFVCLQNSAGEVLGSARFGADAAGLRGLQCWVEQLAGAGPVAVAVERSGGVLVASLLVAGWSVWAINPKQSDRFRERFTVAGAKDDRRDAEVLASSLRTDPKAFREVVFQPAEIVELRGLERHRSDLQADLLRHANRLRAALEEYFPAACRLLVDHLPDQFCCAALQAAADPDQARTISEADWSRLLSDHRIRRFSALDLCELFAAPAAPALPGAAAAGRVVVHQLVAGCQLLLRQLRDLDKAVDKLLKRLAEPADDAPEELHEVARVLRAVESLPGVGPVIASKLLGEAYSLLASRDIDRLRAESGVAPVTRQSSKSRQVVRRTACNRHLRDALFHWARLAMCHDPAWKARYAALRADGKRHARALRTIGDRLLGVLDALLRDGTVYDRAHRRSTPEPAT